MNTTFMIIIVIVVFFVIQYFLAIRPQQKKQTQHAQMIESLIPGDKVRTIGGFIGIVETIYEDAFVLKMEPDGGKMEIVRDAISAKIEETPDYETLEYDEDEDAQIEQGEDKEE